MIKATDKLPKIVNPRTINQHQNDVFADCRLNDTFGNVGGMSESNQNKIAKPEAQNNNVVSNDEDELSILDMLI